MSHNPTASVILIGNELLSGRTQDANLNYIAKGLNEIGITLCEAAIIPDVEAVIVDTLNDRRRQRDYVFTTGGIGPTHDDITAACVAKAFGLPLVQHPEALALMERHYGKENFTEARKRMANVPQGARLIPNPVSIAPGFVIENVYVLAGVPSICHAMFDSLKGSLKGGRPVLSRTTTVFLPESLLALPLEDIQKANPDVEIGSYPFVRQNRIGVSLVARSPDIARVTTVENALHELCTSLGGEPFRD